MTLKQLLLLLPLAALAVAASNGAAGGIDDLPCPNVAGENTNTCPAGTVGTPYEIRFVEREGSGCGRNQQTFHLDSGIAPPGLSLTPDGVLSGVPLEAGRFHFYVEMREPKNRADCAGKETQKRFTLPIRRPLSIVSAPVSPVSAEVGIGLRTAFRASGGTGYFTWSLVRGELAPGLRLVRSGAIRGTPRAVGSYRFTVRASDGEKRSGSWTTTIRVAPRLAIRTERLSPARVGRPYRASVAAAGGVGSRAWTVERGRLPRGLRLARASGRIVGKPATTGSYEFTIGVRDELRAKAARTFTIVVRAASRAEQRPRSGMLPMWPR
jgi:large repetitive protein